MKPWWKESPQCREQEYSALAVAGVKFKEDEDALKQGVLVLHLEYPFQGKIKRLIAVYPNEYPYFHPFVYAPDENLKRHFNPVSKGLCLIGDRTEEWEPEDTLADYLAKRMPLVFGDQEAELATGWQEQAAPDSIFFTYEPVSHVLVDGSWSAEGGYGTLDVAAELQEMVGTDLHFVRGIVTRINGAAGHPSFNWRGRWSSRFNTNFKVPFAHVGELDFIDDPFEHLSAVSALRPKLRYRDWQPDPFGEKCALVAINFSEEIATNEIGLGWMFFWIRRSPKWEGELITRVRSYRAGLKDFGARVPAVTTLRGKKILLVGCGAVGAPIAVDLARCGANLRLLDYDIIEPGPTVRWPLGAPFYGFPKDRHLAAFLNENFPYAETEHFHVHIGAGYEIDKYTHSKTQRNNFGKALKGVDLIVDASAEVGVQQYLSTLALKKKIPYIYASATPGAVGGMIGRFVPGDDQGCWFCLQRAIHTEGDIPEPKKDNGGHVLVPGCTHPTFTGAAFDLAEVSMQTMRVIVQVFNEGVKSVFLRMEFSGPHQFPEWKHDAIPRYDDCPQCQT